MCVTNNVCKNFAYQKCLQRNIISFVSFACVFRRERIESSEFLCQKFLALVASGLMVGKFAVDVVDPYRVCCRRNFRANPSMGRVGCNFGDFRKSSFAIASTD